MRCTHCRQEITRAEPYGRLDAGVRLSDGTRIARDVSLHERCEGSWWLQHHPWICKPYTRVA